MIVDELQTYKEPSLTYVIEGIFRELDPKGTVPTEAGEEVAQEGVEEAPEPFAEKVPRSGDHEEGTYKEVDHEEDVLKVFPKGEEGGEVYPKTKDVGEGPPSTPVLMKVDASKSPLPRMSFILSAPAILGSTSLLRHYFSTEVCQS